MTHETGAARSVPEMLLRRVEATPHAAAFLHPDGDGWKTLTWQQTGDRVRAIACGLLSLGLDPEGRCAILSSTRIEWILADLGILCAGGATTTIYPANTVEECVYILQDCEASFVFVEDASWLGKLAKCRGDIPNVKNVIVLEGPGSQDGWAIPLADLESRGKAHEAAHPEAYEKAVRGVGASSLATLIYTSGTTGQPKGVELTHDCWVYEAEAIDALQMIGPDDLQYLLAPARACLWEGAAGGPDPHRLSDRRGRAGGQARREPEGHPSDLHLRRPPHLREGLQQGSRQGPGVGRPQVQALPLGAQRRPESLEAPPGRGEAGRPACR